MTRRDAKRLLYDITAYVTGMAIALAIGVSQHWGIFK